MMILIYYYDDGDEDDGDGDDTKNDGNTYDSTR